MLSFYTFCCKFSLRITLRKSNLHCAWDRAKNNLSIILSLAIESCHNSQFAKRFKPTIIGARKCKPRRRVELLPSMHWFKLILRALNYSGKSTTSNVTCCAGSRVQPSFKTIDNRTMIIILMWQIIAVSTMFPSCLSKLDVSGRRLELKHSFLSAKNAFNGAFLPLRGNSRSVEPEAWQKLSQLLRRMLPVRERKKWTEKFRNVDA